MVKVDGRVHAVGRTQAAAARNRSATDLIPGVKLGRQMKHAAQRLGGARLGHLIGTRAHLIVLAEDGGYVFLRLADVSDWEMKATMGRRFLDVHARLRNGAEVALEIRPPGTGTVVTTLALAGYLANVQGNLDIYRSRRAENLGFAELLAGYLSLVPMG